MFNLSCFSCVVESEVRQPCLELQLTECAGRGLGCVVDVGEFRTNECMSRRFGERRKATTGCFIGKEYVFREKWYIEGYPCINHGKTSYKGLDLGAEPPRINICWVIPLGFPYTKCSCRAVKNISNKLHQCALNHNKLFGDFCRQIKSSKSGPKFFKFQSMSGACMSILDWILCRADERSVEVYSLK